jgi:hypothetical protein
VTAPRSDSSLQLDASSIVLGPNLPMVAYHATERWHPDRIGAIALYCSDGRWGEAFDEFCHRHLQIPRYDRWAVPGGPAWVAGHAEDAPLLLAARTQLDFLVRVHELEQVVLNTHYACAWYSERLGQSADENLPAQTEDVRAAAAQLQLWYPGLRVDAYLGMRMHDWFTFHQLDLAVRPSRAERFVKSVQPGSGWTEVLGPSVSAHRAI